MKPMEITQPKPEDLVHYGVHCSNCGIEKVLSSEKAPTTVVHFIKIAQAIEWKLVLEETTEKGYLFCNQECIDQWVQSKQ